jgi:DNA-directed RNA polymerase specialized sigma24 family protein
MTAGASVTQLIDRLKEGDREAAQRLWERYFGRLVLETRRWLRHTPRQAADEEDVALSAFDSVCRRAAQGRFPRLFDRNDLWQLLVVIAFRKTCNQIKHERARRPPGRRVVHASALAAGPGGDEGALFADLIGRGPSPALAAQTAEECRRLLAELGDDELRQVALWKLEGYTTEEIAPRMDDGEGRSEATVRRKLDLIRLRWQKEVSP